MCVSSWLTGVWAESVPTRPIPDTATSATRGRVICMTSPRTVKGATTRRALKDMAYSVMRALEIRARTINLGDLTWTVFEAGALSRQPRQGSTRRSHFDDDAAIVGEPNDVGLVRRWKCSCLQLTQPRLER